MNILLALDSSTKATGVAIFKDGKYVRSGVVRALDKDVNARLHEMISKIHEVIDKVKPTDVVFEDVRVLKNAHVTVVLQEILGAIIGKCISNGIHYECLSPASWRSIHGLQKPDIKRDEYKILSVNKVKELFNKEVTDDESDAILLGSAYMEIKGE